MTEDMRQLIDYLSQHNACAEALEWLARQRSPEAAWRTCQRGDFLVWLLAKFGIVGESWSEARRPLVRLACRCARRALRYMGAEARQCVQVTEGWCRGERTREEVLVARDDALSATAAASATAASAALAACDATAICDSDCSGVAANAVLVICDAASAVARDRDYSPAVLARCADYCREAADVSWDGERITVTWSNADPQMRVEPAHTTERRMAVPNLDLNNIYKYYPPTAAQQGRYEALRVAAKGLAQMVIDYCPDSRERSLALTKIEEAVMWANAAIARNEVSGDT